MCLSYGATVATAKWHMVERHCSTSHKSFQANYPPCSELRPEKVCELKAAFGQRAVFFHKAGEKSEASFRAANVWIKNNCPWRQQRGKLTSTILWRGSLWRKKGPLEKLVSMTTDGAHLVTGRHADVIALCRGDPDFPKFLHFHCMIHQQAMCQSDRLWSRNDSHRQRS